MAMTVTAINDGFAAEISGIDLTKPLTREDFLFLDAAMNHFAVVVLHGQFVNDEQQLSFSLGFGPLEPTHDTGVHLVGKRQLLPDVEDISNLDEEGVPVISTDRRRIFALANQLWHSDNSFQAHPPSYSILSGRVVVNEGGRTEFADMRRAYDALSSRERRDVATLVCEHSWIHSRALLGLTEVTATERVAFAPVQHPLVRMHPASRRNALYLSSHIGNIVGWPLPEARMYLRHLTERAIAAGPIYSHAWRDGDVVMWDNRATMHRATPFDPGLVRDMRRTTVAGAALRP